MNELKYNIVQSKRNPDWIRAIVFNGLLGHIEMQPKEWIVISAGFCDLSIGQVKVYGRSDSLNLDSRKEDEDIIWKTLHKCNGYM